MKRIFLISIFTVLASFSIFSETKENNLHLEVSGFLGIKNGEQNEFVYTKVNNTYEKLSQLDWTMKDLFYSGAKINFLYKNFSFSAAGAGFFPKESGIMTDSDWQGISIGFTKKTNLSYSENELLEGFFLDTNAGYRLKFSDFFSLRTNLGFEYNYYFFMAKNGYGWYGDYKTTGDYKTSYDDEKAKFYKKGQLAKISLKRIDYSIYILVNPSFCITKYIEINPFFKIVPFSFFKEVDHHYDFNSAGTFWYDIGNSFFSENQFGIEIIAKPLKKISFCFEYSYTFNIRYKGEIAINTEGEEKPFVLQKGIKSAFEQKMHNFSIGAKWTIF